MSRSLLAHVVSRFAPRQWENVATESLLYLLKMPDAEQALAQLVAPAGFTLPSGLSWSTQAADAKDDAVPDLVGNDAQGRHVLIIESKFWAGLTPNQPLTYLARQREHFEGPDGHLLVFLAPDRRVELLAAELAERLGGALVTRHGALLSVEGPDGRLAVTSWAAVLNLLQSSLAAHSESLVDLAQLRGLCDRADSEAVLPIGPDEVGSDRGRRVWDYVDLVDRVTDRLVAGKVVDTKRLRATGGKGWYGRYVRSSGGHILRLSVSAWHWGWMYPTPWWLRLWNPTNDVEQALQPLVGVDVAYLYRNDAGRLYVGLYPPLMGDEDTMLSRLTAAVRAVCEALPPTAPEQAPLDAVTDESAESSGEAADLEA